VNPQLLLILIALLYILIVGGLSALRREGFSIQFAVEVAAIAGLLVVFSLLTGQLVHPVVALIAIYLVTMRARLLVDLGNMLARRGSHRRAAAVYSLALKLKPDGTSRQIVALNQGVHQLQQGQLAEAVDVLQSILAAPQSHLGPKYEAAARYNLAVAYRRQSNEAKAVIEFNKVVDVMPASLYASRAQMALTKGKRPKETTDDPAESLDAPQD
jgi:tetratricopeptide (TPR) repeat protein